MSTVLLDTNIVSYLFKGDTRAAAYAPLLLRNEWDAFCGDYTRIT